MNNFAIPWSYVLISCITYESAMKDITTGAQIRAGRVLLGWSRADLASAAGLHRHSIGYWEHETKTPSRTPIGCERIAQALRRAGIKVSLTSR
jgi:DNA-binding XRE family transcriptional regulator